MSAKRVILLGFLLLLIVLSGVMPAAADPPSSTPFSGRRYIADQWLSVSIRTTGPTQHISGAVCSFIQSNDPRIAGKKCSDDFHRMRKPDPAAPLGFFLTTEDHFLWVPDAYVDAAGVAQGWWEGNTTIRSDSNNGYRMHFVGQGAGALEGLHLRAEGFLSDTPLPDGAPTWEVIGYYFGTPR